MNTPAWKAILTPEVIKSTGFEPFTQENTDPDYQYVARAIIDETQSVYVDIWYREDSPEQLYLSLGVEEPDWLRLPIDATPDSLKSAYAAYVEPALNRSPLDTTSDRASLKGDFKSLKWNLGVGSHDGTIQSIENDLTLNGWLQMEAVRLASLNNGIHSQWHTQYSHSLITVTREQVTEQDSVHVLEIQYRPVTLHEAFTKQCLEQHADNLYESLPNDLPLDVLGFLARAPFPILEDSAQTMQRIKNGQQDYLLVLATLTSDEDFEAVFMPFTRSESEMNRNFTAQEAWYRKNQKVLDAAITAGINKDLQARIEAVQAAES